MIIGKAGTTMNIQKEGIDSIRVDLTADELQEFRLTYPLLNYQDQKTRRLLDQLLKNAGALLGFVRSGGKLLIEIFPAPRQGCTVYFTNLEKKGRRFKQKPPTAYLFSNSEDLLSAVEQLSTTPAPKSELYRLNDNYLLILQEQEKNALSEYGDRISCTKKELAYIREHGTLLASPYAVKTLLQGLNKPKS
jgi:negative regulator of genetic competence, sporulation and motility